MTVVTRTHRLAVARAWCGEDDVSKRIMTWAESGGGDDWPIILQGLERLAQLVADAEGAWIPSPVEPPAIDSFAWVIWNGVVQDQPWQWVNTDDDEACFFFDGHNLQLDEVDAYLPIAQPKPPEQP
jgi:hypothetical protein